MIGGTGSLAVNPTLLPNVGYDVRKDFAPVGLIGISAMIVLIHPSIPAKSIPELIALAKKDPGKFNYASAGVGSGIHLGAELFASMAGVKLMHIPYKGTGPALTDLLGGHVSMYFSSLPSAIGIVKDGKVRALAVTGDTALRRLPGRADGGGGGLPGFEAVLRYGIVAPAGTPRPIVDKLNAALRQALADPDTIARMARDGTDSVPSTPEEYAADIDREETQVVGGGEALGRGVEVARLERRSILSACAGRESVSESASMDAQSRQQRRRAKPPGSTISTISCAGTASRNSATCRTPAMPS